MYNLKALIAYGKDIVHLYKSINSRTFSAIFFVSNINIRTFEHAKHEIQRTRTAFKESRML